MAGLSIDDILDALQLAGCLEDVHSACATACRRLSCNFFLYSRKYQSTFNNSQYFLLSAFPKEWQQHYQKNRLHLLDPILHHCRESIVPIIWSDAKRGSEGAQRSFFQEAATFGLKNGLTCPVRGLGTDSAIFSVATSRTDLSIEKHLRDTAPLLHFFAHHLHQTIDRLVSVKEITPSRKLTKREQQCLAWAADGKTSWEISRILGISERTVFFHIGNAMDKLEVSSRQQAVARAVSLGLV